MPEASHFIAATLAAEAIRRALADGREEVAIRFLTEAVGRLIAASEAEAIPPEVVSKPGRTGDERWDTLLATAYAFALARTGREPLGWMLAANRLADEWCWDGGELASPAFRDLIRRDTPLVFLEKNILVREKDWFLA